jgi:hypothetical protein
MEFLEVPVEVLTEVRRIALALPEAFETQSPVAHELRIRRRIFAHVLAIGAEGDAPPATMVILRADPDEREVLVRIGHPYFAPRTGQDRVGVVVGPSTDWEEIAELLTESYRLLAPKKLAAALDDQSTR